MSDEPTAEDELPVPVISMAIDDVALAALAKPSPEAVYCSVCDTRLDGKTPTSSGLLMWTRGDEVRFDEPPLCHICSTTIGVSAYHRWISGDLEH